MVLNLHRLEPVRFPHVHPATPRLPAAPCIPPQVAVHQPMDPRSSPRGHSRVVSAGSVACHLPGSPIGTPRVHACTLSRDKVDKDTFHLFAAFSQPAWPSFFYLPIHLLSGYLNSHLGHLKVSYRSSKVTTNLITNGTIQTQLTVTSGCTSARGR
jgi:hypothetical protein